MKSPVSPSTTPTRHLPASPLANWKGATFKMEIQTDGDLKLDFEDLVDELNQFEQDAKALKDRIARLMDDAKVAFDVGDPVQADD